VLLREIWKKKTGRIISPPPGISRVPERRSSLFFQQDQVVNKELFLTTNQGLAEKMPFSGATELFFYGGAEGGGIFF
jgi:hypothetical protein